MASLSFFWGSETKTPDGQKGNKGFSGRALADIRASVDIQHTLIIHDHVCDTLPQANKIVAKQPFILQCGILYITEQIKAMCLTYRRLVQPLEGWIDPGADL